jgi:hypothetical protein
LEASVNKFDLELGRTEVSLSKRSLEQSTIEDGETSPDE